MTDVDRIDDYLGECCRDTKVIEAWQTLKAAVLGTTTNMPTTPCEKCGGSTKRIVVDHCEACDF